MTMALDVKISYSWINYCRLCLLDNGIMLPLFEEEGLKCQLGKKIESCLQLVTYDGDPLPRKICHTCLFKLNKMYEFQTMAFESYERLMSHLLPLKHVPDVNQYLEKADRLQKSLAGQDSVPSRPYSSATSSTSSKCGMDRTLRPKIKVKSETEMEGEPNNSSWSQSMSTSEFSDRRALASSSTQPDESSAAAPNSELSVNIIADTTGSSKRKWCNLQSNNPEINRSSPERKKNKCQKQLAGPASQKKLSLSKSNQLVCVFCHSPFKNGLSLKLHMGKCRKCSVCGLDFSSVSEKAIHEAKKHLSVLINCNEEYLQEHCKDCNAVFASSVMLNTHLINEHPSVNIPETRESSVELINDSLTVKTNNVSGDCSISTSSSIISATEPDCHENIKDATMKFMCQTCKELFESQKGLNSHMRVHAVKNTSSKKSSIQSSNSVKKNSTLKKKTLSCHTCFEEFEEEEPFILHLYKHATEQSDDESMPKKSRKAPQAPSRSSLSSNEDAEIPSEQFSVKCERCHVVCRSKEYYKVHLATHVSKAKTSFPCSGCTQVFRNVEALNRHTCCGKNMENLQMCCLDCGQELVTGEDHVCDNKCPQCEKVFKSSRGQRLHFVHKHGATVPTEDMENYDQVANLRINLGDFDELDLEKEDEPAVSQHDAEPPSMNDSGKCRISPQQRSPPDGAPLHEEMFSRITPTTSEKIPLSKHSDKNVDKIASPSPKPQALASIDPNERAFEKMSEGLKCGESAKSPLIHQLNNYENLPHFSSEV